MRLLLEGCLEHCNVVGIRHGCCLCGKRGRILGYNTEDSLRVREEECRGKCKASLRVQKPKTQGEGELLSVKHISNRQAAACKTDHHSSLGRE